VLQAPARACEWQRGEARDARDGRDGCR
jgi:hypothetical protein